LGFTGSTLPSGDQSCRSVRPNHPAKATLTTQELTAEYISVVSRVAKQFGLQQYKGVLIDASAVRDFPVFILHQGH
jgi:hypothetical protein